MRVRQRVQHRAAVLACAWIALGCGTPRMPAAAPVRAAATEAEAIIGVRSARFAFPEEVSDTLTWPPPIAHAYDGFPTRVWDLSWGGSLPADRRGTDPERFTLKLGWRREAPRTWSLRELVAQFRPAVMTLCQSCDGPASIPSQDRAVKALTDGRRVVFVVEGRGAIRRLFPVVPDTVTFMRHVGGQESGRIVYVAVQHREP